MSLGLTGQALEDWHEKGLNELQQSIDRLDDYDPQSVVGDVVNVSCADGVRRDLEIVEVREPGLLSYWFGTGCAKIFADDGREIGEGYDGAGWLEQTYEW